LTISDEKKATIISSSIAFVLTVIKLTVGILSNSVSLLASAIDSVLDLGVSLFNYFAIINSEKPADKYFNYGRGKIEALASVVEGTIITISGIFLFYTAIKKYITKETSFYLEESIWIMIISLIITICLVVYLNFVANKTNNMVIKADALHYKTDVWTNIAVLLSLFFVSLTKIELFDVIIGGAISIYIVYNAYELIKNGVLVLLDRALEDNITNSIKEIFKSQQAINNYHFLKTRTAGNFNFVDVHLVFDCVITLVDAHKVSDIVEKEIKKLDTQKTWIINIHLDPYDDS
jgi:cation diffusion facilitator family transporter